MLHLFEELSPHARVATAVLPFVLAIILRIVLGRNKLTRMLFSLSTVWFTINVLLAPYSAGMRQDLLDLGHIFR